MKSLAVATALLLVLATAAQAQSASRPPIRIEGSCARATPGGAKNGAAIEELIAKAPFLYASDSHHLSGCLRPAGMPE